MGLLAISLGVITGWLRGGSLRRLAYASLEKQELIIAALLLQALLAVAGRAGWSPVAAWAPFILLLSYGILLYAFWGQTRLPGFKAVFTGVVLNVAAISANGGRMPVATEALARLGVDAVSLPPERVLTHVLLPQSDMRLAFLGDIIPIPLALPWQAVVSVGDLALYAGIFWFVAQGMTAPVVAPPRRQC